MSKTAKWICLAANAIVTVLVFWCMSHYFTSYGSANMMVSGFLSLRFFTNLSNILMGIGTLIHVIWLLCGKEQLSGWLFTLKYAGVVSVLITFITTTVFLAPQNVASSGSFAGYFTLFAGDALWLHLVIPVAALVLFLLYDRTAALPKHMLLYGVLPMFLYAIVYMFEVVIFKVWPDFYGFTFGGHLLPTIISLLVMHLLAFGLSVAVRALWRRVVR